MPEPSRTKDIPTQIKNPELVERRRRQIADSAVQLFIRNGFHKTTTRQISQAAGFSIGSLYEYIASKEDILYLVCDSIHTEVERLVTQIMSRAGGGVEALTEVIREYFLVCDRMSDFILLIYQETRSLPNQWQKRVLENELRITGLFIEPDWEDLGFESRTAQDPVPLLRQAAARRRLAARTADPRRSALRVDPPGGRFPTERVRSSLR